MFPSDTTSLELNGPATFHGACDVASLRDEGAELHRFCSPATTIILGATSSRWCATVPGNLDKRCVRRRSEMTPRAENKRTSNAASVRSRISQGMGGAVGNRIQRFGVVFAFWTQAFAICDQQHNGRNERVPAQAHLGKNVREILGDFANWLSRNSSASYKQGKPC